MQAFRHLLAQRHLTVLMCAATLLLKLWVPTGYMIDTASGHIAITLCSGFAPVPMTMAMPGLHRDMPDHGKSEDHGKAEMPCAFAGLAAAMTGAIDPVQLAVLIAFVMATGLICSIPPAPSDPIYLRPPLRGPPARL